MAEIRLPSGLIAFVDDEDFDRVSQIKWHAQHNKRHVYAVHRICLPGRRKKRLFMHRFIIDAQPGLDVDHWDRDGLNNRRANLRQCTRSQNLQNRRGHGRFAKGVTLKNGKYYAQVGHTRLGSFNSEVEAAEAYDWAASKLFGQFARLNFDTRAGGMNGAGREPEHKGLADGGTGQPDPPLVEE